MTRSNLHGCIDLGSRWELMVDDHLFEKRIGDASLRLHQPTPRELVTSTGMDARPDTDYRYPSVFRDGDLYRMYYGLLTVTRTSEGKSKYDKERICYAQSTDGIQWHAPSLGLVEFEGSTDNNIVWMEDGSQRFGVEGFAAFRDDNPACDPAHRYKAIAAPTQEARPALGGYGLLSLGSPDGLRWSMISPTYIMVGGPGRGMFDSQNVVFWDSVRGEYRMYRREVYIEGPEEHAFRAVLTAVSPDFLTWSKPQRLYLPGAEPVQLYTNNVLPYFRAPHLFVGFPTRYVQRQWSPALEALPEVERRRGVVESVNPHMAAALSDGLFMTSRDGLNFNLWNEAFIRPGLRMKNNWFKGDNYQNWGVITTPSHIDDAPDELSFFVGEGNRRAGTGKNCRRYTLRLDGFVSLHASGDGGEMITRPVTFEGDSLYVNFSASAAGGIRIELQDMTGRPLRRFGLDNAVELIGDDLHRRVQWTPSSDLSSLVGTPIRLRIQVVDADIYAWGFGGKVG